MSRERYIGKWLKFKAESNIFGSEKQHLGFIVGDNEKELFLVAVYVTSQWDSRDRARILRGDPEETLVWIRGKSEKGSRHFNLDSVIDCAFPKTIQYSKFEKLINQKKIEVINGKNGVNTDLIEEVRSGIKSSRQVSNIVKKSLI